MSTPAADRKLLIEPSSTSVPLGKAKLSVSPLSRQPGAYTGYYQVRVSPLFFASEKGTLSAAVSDETLRKLSQGNAVDFTGRATSSDDGQSRVIQGHATPVDKDRGTLRLSFTTKNTKVVFNTTYHFAEK